ncbi:hypothetical protein [Novosphingobium sp.]|uniref:hypothetical protein n=1 Tax=Novosphingobium sp. TaxID=1874826 RepID=UPI002635083A|nr:hypothetical protein [Novosphingobium sp.]
MSTVSERLSEPERATSDCLIQRTARKHALTEGAELFVCYSLARSASAKMTLLTNWLRETFRNPPCWDL